MPALPARLLVASIILIVGLAGLLLGSHRNVLKDASVLRHDEAFFIKQQLSKTYEDYSSVLESSYTVDDRLAYGDYEVFKLTETKRVAAETEREHQYAVLRKNGRHVARFKFAQAGGYNTKARFGLFPILGGETKQLVVELTTHRGWQYWVVDLYPEFKVLYNSGDYNVGYSLDAVDLDGDGRFELIHTLHTFWFFHGLSNTNSPLIEIVFKYDPRVMKYVPANPQFSDFTLKDIYQRMSEAKIASRAPKKLGDDLCKVMEVVLRLLYAGREEEAWFFYNQEYNQPDKATIKSEIQKKLREDSVYSKLANSSR